jgi:hypothetical protein
MCLLHAKISKKIEFFIFIPKFCREKSAKVLHKFCYSACVGSKRIRYSLFHNSVELNISNRNGVRYELIKKSLIDFFILNL